MKLQVLEAVEAEMARRALAEIAGHYVLGADHGLFDLTARTVVTGEPHPLATAKGW
jgi:hypothetical protein